MKLDSVVNLLVVNIIIILVVVVGVTREMTGLIMS